MSVGVGVACSCGRRPDGLAGFWRRLSPDTGSSPPATGAALLVAGLGHGFSALHSREEARGAEAVVVLGGGAGTMSGGGQVVGVLTPQSILRALEGARVAKLIGAKLVIASGGLPRPDLQLKPESEMIAAMPDRRRCAGGSSPPGVVVEDHSRSGARDPRHAPRAGNPPVRARDLARPHGPLSRCSFGPRASIRFRPCR